ncbi:MAG: putative transrane anti-sigma factor [Chloroflexi bacterium]|nr:putative transrane anti-sigma factor [Chloroflexota bacterium]
MHTNEGTLRAYLDGELEAPTCTAVAAHLRECAACRKQLDKLASRASATSHYLQALAPRALPVGKVAELPAPAPVALSRLHARLADETSPASSSRMDRQTSSGGLLEMFKRMFNSRYRAAWAGLAAALVIVSLFAFEPARVAAGQFLGLFRVRKFAVVSINPSNLRNLDKLGGQIDQLLSDSVTFVKQPGEPVAVASAAEASQKAGIPVRLPASLKPSSLMVQDGVDAKLKVDLARAQAILDVAGRTDIKLPKAIDGADVEFIVPPMMQLASPTVNTPPGVNIAQVGEMALQLAGLTPAEAQHFSQAIDWSSTLVIPLPTDAGSFRDVTVDGVPGVLIESNPRQSGGPRNVHYTLFWQKNDTVYALSGTGDATRAIEIAASLR